MLRHLIIGVVLTLYVIRLRWIILCDFTLLFAVEMDSSLNKRNNR